MGHLQPCSRVRRVPHGALHPSARRHAACALRRRLLRQLRSSCPAVGRLLRVRVALLGLLCMLRDPEALVWRDLALQGYDTGSISVLLHLSVIQEDWYSRIIPCSMSEKTVWQRTSPPSRIIHADRSGKVPYRTTYMHADPTGNTACSGASA